MRQDERAIVDWLRACVRPGHTLMTICSGALLAARAGLLDGYSCTTHHAECGELAALAPRAKVLDNRLFVIDGERYTSAGVTAGLDLMLNVVSSLAGHACALAIARHLVLYLRREGADPQISPWLAGRNHLHPAVHRVQDAIIANPAENWTLTRLAKIANTSSRHLSRLFNEHAGMNISLTSTVCGWPSLTSCSPTAVWIWNASRNAPASPHRGSCAAPGADPMTRRPSRYGAIRKSDAGAGSLRGAAHHCCQCAQSRFCFCALTCSQAWPAAVWADHLQADPDRHRGWAAHPRERLNLAYLPP